MYKLTSDKAAAVSTDFFWLPVEKVRPPSGAKVLLINERFGVAVIGAFSDKHEWTHWAPLPKFRRKQ